MGHTSTQRPKSFFSSKSDQSGGQPTQSISQSHYQRYSDSMNKGRDSGQEHFGSSSSSDKRSAGSAKQPGGNFKPFSSSNLAPRSSPVQGRYLPSQERVSQTTVKPRDSTYNPASNAISAPSSYLRSSSQNSIKPRFGQNSLHQNSCPYCGGRSYSQKYDQSINEHKPGPQVVNLPMPRSQHSRGQTQTNVQPISDSKPVTTINAAVYKPLSVQGVRKPWSQSPITGSTGSSLSPRSLQTTYKPVQGNYQSSMSNRKPHVDPRLVGRTQGVASTFKPGQQSEYLVKPQQGQTWQQQPSSHSSLSPGRGTPRPRSLHTFYKPPHSAPPAQGWFDPTQTWNLQSSLLSNGQYFVPPQSQRVSRPSVSSVGQNAGSRQLEYQQRTWKPAASAKPPLPSHHQGGRHGQQGSMPARNVAQFFPGSIPTFSMATAKPQIWEDPNQDQRQSSVSISNLHFKPQQNRQISNHGQSNHQSLPSRFSATSVAQHAERPQQSQYSTRPGQSWHQISSHVATGQFAKPEQSQQTLRPTQGNFQASQSRFPASSVGQHTGSWKPVGTAKPVHDLQQQTSFPPLSMSPMHAWSLLSPISSQTRDPLTSSDYQTSQSGFNDQVLTQFPSSLKPASHNNNNNYGFKPSQNSRPSTHRVAQSTQNTYKPDPPRIQPVQSTSKPASVTDRDKGSQQQGQLPFAYPQRNLYVPSHQSTFIAPGQSSRPVFSHGMASGTSNSGLGQTKG